MFMSECCGTQYNNWVWVPFWLICFFEVAVIGPEKDHHKLLYLSQVPMVGIKQVSMKLNYRYFWENRKSSNKLWIILVLFCRWIIVQIKMN